MRQVTAKTSQVISLGKQGENGALQVLFPVMENLISTYGEGAVSLVAQRPHEPFTYFADTTSDAENVYWTIKKEDVAIPGDGRCQLNYVVDGVIVKSHIYKTLITPSMGEKAETLNPYVSWVNGILSAVANVSEAAGMIVGAKLPFIATYGETSYIDVATAVSQGRPVIAINSNGLSALLTTKTVGGAYHFERVSVENAVKWALSTDGVWSSTATDLGGDMKKSAYDTTNTGNKVDTALNAENLGTKAASTYLNTEDAGVTYAKPGLVFASASNITTMEALKAQLNTWVSGMSANMVRFFLVNVPQDASFDPFVQAGYLVMIYKRSSDLACAFLMRASGVGNYVHAMTMTAASTWTDPGTILLASGTVSASQARNIYAGTSDMTAGTSDLKTGVIYLVYEV